MRPVAVAGCAMVVLAACGGGSGTTDTVAATTIAPATTQAPAPTDAPTTTAAGMSRDATLAVARCADSFGFLFAESVSLDRSRLTDAIDLCDEATLQVKLEPGAPAGLKVALLTLAVDLAKANVAALGGGLDVDGQATLQAAVDAFAVAWG